jgi:hypothetical protein
VQKDVTVDASGEIDFQRASVTSWEAGLEFTPLVKTMPAEPRLQSGSRVGFKKRIPQVNVMVKDTQHLTINGQEVAFRRLGSDLLDEAVESFTGTKRVGGLLGFSQEAQITVSRTVPLPATVVGLDYRVAVWGGT